MPISRRQAFLRLSPLLAGGCRRGDGAPLRMLSISFQEAFPLHASVELGYLRDAGITLQIEEMPRGSQITESLVGGSADLAYHTCFDTLLRVPGGRRLQSFCTVTVLPAAVLAVSASAAGRIQGVEDLKGSVVGIAGFGSAHHRQLEAILAVHGLSTANVELVALGNGASSIAAMEHGKVSVAILNTSVLNALQKRSPGIRVLVDPRTASECQRIFGVDAVPSHCLMATSTWIERNPEMARGMAHAMVKTMRWIREHPPEEVRALLPERLRTTDADADLDTIRFVAQALSMDGRMPPEGPTTVRRLYTLPSEQQMGGAADLAGSFTNTFVDAL